MTFIALTDEQWNILLNHDDCPGGPPSDADDVQWILSFARETLDELDAEGCPRLWDIDVQDTTDPGSATVMVLLDPGVTTESGAQVFYLASSHMEIRYFKAPEDGGNPFRYALEEIISTANLMHEAWHACTH